MFFLIIIPTFITYCHFSLTLFFCFLIILIFLCTKLLSFSPNISFSFSPFSPPLIYRFVFLLAKEFNFNNSVTRKLHLFELVRESGEVIHGNSVHFTSELGQLLLNLRIRIRDLWWFLLKERIIELKCDLIGGNRNKGFWIRSGK